MSRTYTGIFSHFSPAEKAYCDIAVKVDAEDRFKAREKLWRELEENHADHLSGGASDIQLCGIVWDGSRLDMQDYFDAQADQSKAEFVRIRSVELSNHLSESPRDEARVEEARRECSGELICLRQIDAIAKDLYQSQGIVPPSIHTELHYAQLMADDLFRRGDYDLADSLSQHIWDAEHWNADSMGVIARLFHDRRIFHDGSYIYMSAYFARDGCCPSSTSETFKPEITQEFGGM